MDIYNKEYFNNIDKYASNERRLRYLVSKILKYKPQRVLDVGCGRGYLVKDLNNRGIKAIGIDISEYAGDLIPDFFARYDAVSFFPFGNKEFDVVVSTDFFEHLKESEIEKTYSEMKRVGKNILAQICFKKEKIANSHFTVKPKTWWKEKLEECEII